MQNNNKTGGGGGIRDAEWNATCSPSQGLPLGLICWYPDLIYVWVERGTVRVKSLAQEHNTMSLAGFEPGPLALVSSALTMKTTMTPGKLN